MKDRIKILIVEDDKLTQSIYRELLTDEIFEKTFAEDGVQALELYNLMLPEVILLDIMLPQMSGYVVLKKIREEIGDKTTAIIMSTSLSGKDDILGCMKLGIQGYVIKPTNYAELNLKIVEYFSKVNPEKARALHQTLQARKMAKSSPSPERKSI